MERSAMATLRNAMSAGGQLSRRRMVCRCKATGAVPSRTIRRSFTSSTRSFASATPIAPRPRSTTTSSTLHFPLSRHSSSSPSTPLGTISSGAAGASSALSAPTHLNAEEEAIFSLLARELAPTELEVKDISGGCGSMYGIEVVSERFRGLGMLQQQRLVNGVLGERVKGWHGVQLRTRCP